MTRSSWLLAAVALAVAELSACGGSGASPVAPTTPAASTPAAPTPGASATSTPAATASMSTVVSGEQTFSGLTRNHVDGPVNYPQHPPVGGDHNKLWAPCNGIVYDAALPDVNAVHSLEHGAVWITWLPTLPATEVEQLHQLVEGVDYRLGSPYPTQSTPIVVTAWGHQMTATAASDPRIATFVTAYTNGPQTPEPGAPCEGGDDSLAPHSHTAQELSAAAQLFAHQ